jgi:hypothetical protein
MWENRKFSFIYKISFWNGTKRNLLKLLLFSDIFPPFYPIFRHFPLLLPYITEDNALVGTGQNSHLYASTL